MEKAKKSTLTKKYKALSKDNLAKIQGGNSGSSEPGLLLRFSVFC